jgi:hypothetical protein
MCRPAVLLAALLPALAGCGASGVAPVAGRVTVNGKPLANATVTFAPVATPGNPEPGSGSYGHTDADGRYTLRLVDREAAGAVVGRHKVQVVLRDDADTAADRPKSAVRQLPPKYNAKTALEFDVPAGGTAAADFDLSVP